MSTEPSQYLKHLPQIFRRTPEGEPPPFLGEFLKTFEALLSGRDDAEVDGEPVVGLEERVERFVDHLDPLLTPLDNREAEALDSEFLSYLAGWVALVLDKNWDLAKRRTWLKNIVPLYRRRGTFDGMTEYLKMFVGNQVRLDEPPGVTIVVGVENNIVGKNTFINGAPPYYFRVMINYGFEPGTFKIEDWRNVQQGTKSIVDLEKPAHTWYDLEARTPGIIINSRSTIGSDTLIWGKSQKI